MPECKRIFSDVALVSGKERDMFRTPLFTYDSAKGLSLWRNCASTSSSEPKLPGKDIFPRLGHYKDTPSKATQILQHFGYTL